MGANQDERLLGLAIIVVVALAGVALLLRGGRGAGDHDPLLPGYPPARFPARHLTATDPLAALAATQARLLTMCRHMRTESDAAIWLRTFLHELREIMNTAYRVAVITEGYGRQAALDRLVAEVEQIERDIAEQISRRLLQRDEDAHAELLAGRLATLELCARELSLLADSGNRVTLRTAQGRMQYAPTKTPTPHLVETYCIRPPMTDTQAQNCDGPSQLTHGNDEKENQHA